MYVMYVKTFSYVCMLRTCYVKAQMQTNVTVKNPQVSICTYGAVIISSA